MDKSQPDLQARLEHELAVIGEYGYTSLFLIVEEILNFARQEGIPFSSRGLSGVIPGGTLPGDHIT